MSSEVAVCRTGMVGLRVTIDSGTLSGQRSDVGRVLVLAGGVVEGRPGRR